MDIEKLQELKARYTDIKTKLAVKEAKVSELKAKLKEKYGITVKQIPGKLKSIKKELADNIETSEKLTTGIELLLDTYEA